MCEPTSLRLELGTVTKIQTWFAFSLLLFIVNVFVSKQSELALAGTLEKDRSSKDILLVSNDGPTTLGDISTFNARIQHTVLHSTSVKSKSALTWCKFYWSVEKEKVGCYNFSSGQSTLRYGHWKSPGWKKVTVIVFKSRQCGCFYTSQEIQSRSGSPYNMLTNTTSILVTDSINLGLTVWQGHKKPRESTTSLFVGEVQMQAFIHGHLFDGQDVKYLWNFGDGKRASSFFPNQSHIYKKDKNYSLSLTATSFAKGKLYNGSFAICLDFRVRTFDVHLVAYGQPGPRLTPYRTLMRNTYLLAPGKVTFILKYKNPFSLVQSVSTDWKIDSYHVENWPSNKFAYNISRLGSHTMWVTYRFHTAHNVYYGTESVKLLIKEPILHLNVSHTPNIPRQHSAVFHITCQGSGPVSFCWSIAKNCRLPNTSSCIPTIESSKCHTIVNHTFSNPGSYCLNVSVMNTVSSAGTYLKIHIPQDHSQPSKSSRRTTAAVLFSVFGLIFMVAGLVFLIRNYFANSRKPVEKADFDFRDEDCRSVSSLNLGAKITGCWYKLDIRRHKKYKQDLILLLDSHGNHYGSVQAN